jgi:hypothetical protein
MKKGKLIRLSEHAKQQLEYRGATKEQAVEAIRTGTWEPDEIIVVTVYVYYF